MLFNQQEINLQLCLQAAVAAAQQAGCIMMDCITKKRSGILDLQTDTKSSSVDFVTKYDKMCDEVIMQSLKEASEKIFVEKNIPYGFLTEETLPDAPVEDYPTWVVDPIDGTTSFMHGHSDCCVSIALAINKQPVVGVVWIPTFRELFTAVRGGGAFFNGMPIPTNRPESSKTKHLKDSLVGYHFPAKRNEVTIKTSLGIVEELLVKHNVHSVRCHGSAAIDCCSVALGRMDVYIELGISAWDIAAGMVILQESGCVAGSLLSKNDESDKEDLKEIRVGKLGIVAAVTRELCIEAQKVSFDHGLYPEKYFQ